MNAIEKDVRGVNHQWARFIFSELLRSGISTFFVSTGSRNTALMVGLADFKEASVITHLDERGAAFAAIGWSRATRMPAALVCTSGTAAANYYPAIIEASLSNIPLLVITADRSVEERDARADQVIDQTRLYSNYLRWNFDFPAPVEGFDVEPLLTAIDQAVYRTISSPQGPVQLNICLRKPHLTGLEEQKRFYRITKASKRWLNCTKPFTQYHPSNELPTKPAINEAARLISHAKKGLIICGSLLNGDYLKSINVLSEKLCWPVLAGITSNLRSMENSCLINHFNLYLTNRCGVKLFSPDIVLHFGGEPVDEPFQEYLRLLDAQFIVVNNHPSRQDPRHNTTLRINADPGLFALGLRDCLSGGAFSSGLLSPLKKADECTGEICSRFAHTLPFTSWQLVAQVCSIIRPKSGLFLGNSLPVREFDRFASLSGKVVTVACNRGVSGIDGNISCAAGFSLGLKQPVTVFVGDVAALHDLNALSLVKKMQDPIIIIIPNNDGGGIFSFLPSIGKTQCFDRLFVNPHGFGFRGAADMFGLDYYSCGSLQEFSRAYESALTLNRHCIIEAIVNREEDVRQQAEILETIAKELD